MALYKEDGTEEFNVTVSTSSFFSGMYTTYCYQCAAPNNYSLGATGLEKSLSGFSLFAELYSRGERWVHEMSYEGRLMEDRYRVAVADFNRTTNFSMSFIGVDYYSPYSKTAYDGFLGLAPYAAEPSFYQTSYMWHLRQSGKIDHNIVSFFVPNREKGWIKFGS
jgi:hypothetical protein